MGLIVQDDQPYAHLTARGRRVLDGKGVIQTSTPELDDACEAIGLVPTEFVDLSEMPMTHGRHHHVAIQWAGGVFWLDMSEQTNHFCVDVRTYRGKELEPTGVFSIEDGRRVELEGLARADVLGHRAVKMPILLTDKP